MFAPVDPSVCSAAIGLLSGYSAMLFRKGSGLHGAAGTVFSVSMLSASGAGAYLAGFVHPNSGNVIGSTLTFYLVATGWVAAKRREGRPGLFDLVALLFGLAVAAIAATWARSGEYRSANDIQLPSTSFSARSPSCSPSRTFA